MPRWLAFAVDSRAARARQRALELGLVPNEELTSLPLNVPDETVEDSLSEVDTDEADGGRMTRARLNTMKVNAEASIARKPLSQSEIAAFDLIDGVPGRSLKRWILGLRLHDDASYNDHLIAATERDASPDAPVDPSALGHRFITAIPNLSFIYLGRFKDWTLNNFWGRNDVERFQAIGALLGAPMCDRTGTLSNGLRMKILHPIPPFDPRFNLSIDQVIERRCRELLSKHDRLHLLWSGGIDTTAVIVGFLRVATSDDWQTKLSVHYCPRSIPENPTFFEKFIQPLPHHFPIDGHLRDFIDGSKAVVTGEPADMLFGTVAMSDALLQGKTIKPPPETPKEARSARPYRNEMYFALEKPWRVIIPKIMRAKLLLRPGKQAEERWLAFIEPQVAKAPIPIVTVYDWYWWMVYSCKFQHDLTRVFFNRAKPSQQLSDSIENFYYSPDWEQWCFHNHHAKMLDKSVWASYKHPLKKYIFDYDGDTAYYAGKTKVMSSNWAPGYQWAIDEEWNVIHFGATSCSRAKLKEKYGDGLDRYMEHEKMREWVIN